MGPACLTRRYGDGMAIRSRSVKPVTITNESGQPEIVLEIDGLTLSMTPPPTEETPTEPEQPST